MRRTTKAEKIAAHESLARYRDATSLLHYLMAFKPSSPQNAAIVVREEDRDGELAVVRVQAYGLGRADGGCVLVTGWTETPAGMCGEAVIFAGYTTDMPDGGDAYYATAPSRALREAFRRTRAAMQEEQAKP